MNPFRATSSRGTSANSIACLILATAICSTGFSAVNVPHRTPSETLATQLKRREMPQNTALEYLAKVDRGEGSTWGSWASSGLKNLAPAFTQTNDKLHSWIDAILLDDAEILGMSELTDYKKLANQIQDNMVQLQSEISTVQKSKLGLPFKKSATPEQIRKKQTKEDRDLEIKRKEELIVTGKQDLEEIEGKIGDFFASNQVTISPEQIRGLLYAAVGDGDIRLIVAFKAIKELSVAYRANAEERNDTASIQWYYGIHALMVRSLLVLHREYVRKIDEEFLPALEKIIAGNQVLTADQLKQIADKDVPEEDKSQARANVKTLQMTKDTADLYKKYLLSARKRIADVLGRENGTKRSGLYQKFYTAEGAFLVWKNANSLADAAKTVEKLEEVLNLQLPALQQFDNKEMEEKFRELTMKLRT